MSPLKSCGYTVPSFKNGYICNRGNIVALVK